MIVFTITRKFIEFFFGKDSRLLGYVGVISVIVIVFAAAAVCALIFTQISSCRQGSFNKKAGQYNANILEKKIEANYVQNQVNDEAAGSNQAVGNYSNSLRIDSNQYSGAGSDDKFCRRYPNDSTCADWRLRNRK